MLSHSEQKWVLGAAILGSSLAFIDTTIVNVALPVLQSSLRASVSDAQWVIDAYLLVLCSLILAGGSLGDQFGRQRVFAIGVALFAGASLWCGVAPDVRHLIAARAVQGIGGALLVPGSLSMITAAFPAKIRGKAIGTWSAMTSMSVIVGPVLGGFLVQEVSWRAAFLINIPIAVAVLFIVWRKVPELGERRASEIDWAGSALVTLGLGGIVFALIEGPGRGWGSPMIVTAAAAGVVAMIVFVVVERRVENPIVPLSLFRSRAFTGANVLTLLLYAALSGATFLLPFNLIQVQEYTPAQAGAAFLPFVATLSLLSRWTGALADRIGPRPLLIAGPLTAAAGFGLLTLPGIGGSYWTTFFPGILVLGLGMAITVAPLTATVMTSIDDERHAGAASGINNAVARAAGLLAIAMLGAVAVIVFGSALDERLAAAGVSPDLRHRMAAQRLKLAAAEPPPGTDVESYAKIEIAVDEAFVRAFRIDLGIAAGLAVASAAGALIVGKGAKR